MSRRKPVELKVVQGSYRADRATSEPRPDVAIPDCPDFLSAEKDPVGNAEWCRVTHELFEQGTLSRIDQRAPGCLLRCLSPLG